MESEQLTESSSWDKVVEINLTAPVNTPQGPGARLRSTREKLNLPVEEAARRLFLTPEMINSIEADNYTKIPGVTFIRGYLRSYARLLNLSEEEIISNFEALGFKDKPSELSTQDLYRKSISFSDTFLPWITGMVAVVLIALVYFWWHSQNAVVTESNLAVQPQIQPAQPQQAQSQPVQSQPQQAQSQPVQSQPQPAQAQPAQAQPQPTQPQLMVVNPPAKNAPGAGSEIHDNTVNAFLPENKKTVLPFAGAAPNAPAIYTLPKGTTNKSKPVSTDTASGMQSPNAAPALNPQQVAPANNAATQQQNILLTTPDSNAASGAAPNSVTGQTPAPNSASSTDPMLAPDAQLLQENTADHDTSAAKPKSVKSSKPFIKPPFS